MVPARAKLNLDLEVVGRRPDGFHDLRTTFQAIDLHDLLEIEPATTTRMTAEGFALDNEDNSVIKAHGAMERAAGTTLPVKIHLIKRIPPGSGMGGASSDAAATLRALQTMFNMKIDVQGIAEELGSDVPFFLIGGRARAQGRGERLQRLDAEQSWFAIAWPGYELATAEVYKKWDEVNGESPNALSRAAEHVEPRLKRFKQQLGAGWQMTGSGSAFFQQVTTEREARHANKAIKNLGCWTVVAAAVPPWA
ncbi:MAG TPA: 4-(cytidine 5'-diphospho)-2-C-methyl-D-erythritol kinase [Candidatus Limnocylindrales bacterium]|nr:4-(cytidine 5'-diphospho)-2-C-methyl-D-erythritol kinase [Candidatus Limnocylindrales bacterium]